MAAERIARSRAAARVSAHTHRTAMEQVATSVAPAAEAPTLLDTLARAPAAAALVVAGLDILDRRALQLVHSQLRDAVGEATTVLQAYYRRGAPRLSPPTPRRWPRLEALRMSPDLEVLQGLGAETWATLRTLQLLGNGDVDVPFVRALAAALRRMPALRSLALHSVRFADEATGALFWASSAAAAPELRSLSFIHAGLTSALATALAATGWRLEELVLSHNRDLGAAGVAALVAAPTFSLRRLDLSYCGLDAASLLRVANVAWPLEELGLDSNTFRGAEAEAAAAVAALSRHARLRTLSFADCGLCAAAFKALVEASWPALTFLDASSSSAKCDGPHALGPAAFAGFPKLEGLVLDWVPLGAAGALTLASRRWPFLSELWMGTAGLGDAGLAALARGAWPALVRLDVRRNGFSAALNWDAIYRSAPALVDLTG